MPQIAELPLDLQERELLRRYHTVERFLCNAPVDRRGPSASEEEEKAAHAALNNYLVSEVVGTLQSGVDLMTLFSAETYRLVPSGCPRLDQLLGGGFREGLITELVGESACGKTQLCLLTTITYAARGERVIFIDTGSSFVAHRAAILLHKAGSLDRAQDAVAEAKRLLSCIRVAPVHTAHALLSVLDSVPRHYLGLPASERPRLIVVDCTTAVLAPVLGISGRGHVLMMAAAQMLKQLAQRLSALVLVTNHVVGSGTGEERPALGESWRAQAHARLHMERADLPEAAGARTRVRVTLRSSTFARCPASVSLELCDAGLV